MISAPDIVSVVLRAIALIALFQAGGAALFIVLFGSRLHDSIEGVRHLGCFAAVLGIVCICGHYALEAARMSGDFAGMLDPSLQGLVLKSPTSEALVLRLVGLGLIFVSLRVDRSRAIGMVGPLLAAIAFTLTGHTSINANRAILAPALLVHVLIGMFWFGSLGPLWLASAREPPAEAGRVIEAFSRTALWVVPLLLVAGFLMTILLVPGWATFTRPYGEMLIAKLILFAGLMVLAAANKRRFGPGIGQGVPSAGPRFRATVVAEAVLICVVLAVTACLTTFFSPE